MKSRKVRVLVVDGDPKAGKVLQHALQKEGYRAELAASLKAGIKLCGARRFHILILDLKLSGGEGIGVLKQFRDQREDMSLVLLNSAPTVESAVASIKSGVYDYVEKPADTHKLLAVVRNIIAEKGLLQKPAEKLLLTVGSRLRLVRQQKQLTLREVAQRTGLSVSLLSQVERAESAASVASLHKIATALNTSLQLLFEGF
jgi:two-component system OmpR family response regulator